MHNIRGFIIGGGVTVLLLGGLLTSVTLAQQPSPRQPGSQRCQSVLSSRTADPVLAKYRERLQTARDAMLREERALINLMAAESTTRAAVDSQAAKVNEARGTLARMRVDMLWELRSVVPPENREQAFRCAGRFLLRRR
jgi:hypothetical protein